MITWEERGSNDTLYGKGLSKDVANLPKDGKEAKNGSEFYVMDTPVAPVTSKIYMFDGENKIWLPQ
jgi:hypothetical protein